MVSNACAGLRSSFTCTLLTRNSPSNPVIILVSEESFTRDKYNIHDRASVQSKKCKLSEFLYQQSNDIHGTLTEENPSQGS